MKFGPVPVAQAGGAILAHSVKAGGRKLRKGITLQKDDLATLAQAGIESVIVARLDRGDLHENAAARRLADALVPDPAAAGLRLAEPFTGRVNILAEGPGVVALDAEAVTRFNRVHPMITVATVPPWQQMGPGGMVATIKVISYGVPEAAVARAEAEARGAIRLAAPVFRSAGLVVTEIPGGPPNDKGIAAIRTRVEALGMELASPRIIPHDAAELTRALSDLPGAMALILTGSATSDPDDVAPSAVAAAGGHVTRFGMPVDPGNLLFLGDLDGRPVIGLPGCARSPALNGADWVLSRVACGLEVSGDDIAHMGVGGLLKEIPTRPQPRAGRRG
ncbi:molybdenum cofactor cytidylyltransferase [Cribrihabitans marinus]|uniref:Molybdenum cofactor cytidylyltransferase n=1 Tax=Cribrihabitans marinus TaxID=1227549 RepID=A0A1H6R2E6_9RHOB|nr:molybdopterin-binding protein [Cribrihabitans marinus]GGH20343.1 molybdopterin biosynthesis protein [Cribrihabitans marinus]SEI49963.1 molybdenum cofactor cytidylyltransferase [Cribrihabitans marinus]